MTPVGVNRQRLDLNSWVCQQFVTHFKRWEIAPHWKVSNSWPRRPWCTVMWTDCLIAYGRKAPEKETQNVIKNSKVVVSQNPSIVESANDQIQTKGKHWLYTKRWPLPEMQVIHMNIWKNYELNFNKKQKIPKLQKLEIISYIYQFWHTTVY